LIILTGKSLLEEVGSLRRSVGEEGSEGLLLPEGKSSGETDEKGEDASVFEASSVREIPWRGEEAHRM